MKKTLLSIALTLAAVIVFAQQEFHVFPENHPETPGTKSGNGSLENPWDLQTALSQKPKIVNGNDTIWLHEGIYNGRFSSTLNSTIENEYITVSAYENDKVVLNGNVDSTEDQTLKVRSSRVIFQNFEITWLGDFTRQINKDGDFKKFVVGINHLSGTNCKFINLMIHNNPGLGFGSWKNTGGTLIANCIVYNNGGLTAEGKSIGEGFYVQNNSDTETRILRDNIIFNNYYKGVEVWSAAKHADTDWVKNITLENNVIFNSGLPSHYRTVDNIIVATDDRNGVNIAKNITIRNNILYHNTNFKKDEINGDAASLTLGFHKGAPVENVVVDNNIIIGRNNALRILYAKSLTLTRNKVYTGYIHLVNPDALKWNFNDNIYYTKKSKAFRNGSIKSYDFENWKLNFNLDANSHWKHIKTFDLNNVLDITENVNKPNEFRVVLFNKDGADVKVDFSKYNIAQAANYTIRDVENFKQILKAGVMDETSQIIFPMNLNQGQANKTLNNFGVFILEFKENTVAEISAKDKGFFRRFFRFLGF
ncbi:right-handed parallel beta-helix repeat-containing protein [Winogradskyella bathintestinalis]|uniref:Right handed beta helix domain-containing protein n=1 Tax=Winogradskyella bathintestinalis TaxID=3035208 RepID=A0ABT7ZUJ9_9FLAO|nr:hypothetical protein [Winogradskyella bathintestinalis]MDN3492691.1 hypothetical protein [Winogradskyella bathintestinalis]